MKLTIEKVSEGVRVEIQTDPAKHPITWTLTREQAEWLASLLKTAAVANGFKFSAEL